MLSNDLITTHNPAPRPERGDMVIQIHPNASIETRASGAWPTTPATIETGTIVTAWVALDTPSDRLHLDTVEIPLSEDSESVQETISRMRDALPHMRSIVPLLPLLRRRGELGDGWAGIDGHTGDEPSEGRDRTYRALEMRDSLTQLWARADREGKALREDQQQLRDQYEAQRAELAELDREVMPVAMRAAVALHLYGMTAHAIAAPLSGIPGPTVDRWLEHLSTADAAALAGVAPDSWRGSVSRGQRPAADGRFGREPWWCRASVLLHLGRA